TSPSLRSSAIPSTQIPEKFGGGPEIRTPKPRVGSWMFSNRKGLSGTPGNNPRPRPRHLFSDFGRLRPLLADSSGTVNSRRPGPRPGPRPCEATFGCPAPAKSSVHTSLVEPHLLHAAPAVYGLVRNQVLHIRPDRVVVQPPPQHGADRSLLALSLDYLNQREALGWVQLLRLPIDQPRDLRVAATGILARRPADLVLVEGGVDTVRGLERIEEHQVAEAGHGWPHGGDRGSFVYCEPLRQVLAQPQSEPAAILGCLT